MATKPKPKDVLKRDFEIRRVIHKQVDRADGETTHTETAELVTDDGDKVKITMSKLPSGFERGQNVTVTVSSLQTKLEDHK
jgi:hypothetical protein